MQADQYVAILADDKTIKALKTFKVSLQEGEDEAWRKLSYLIDPIHHYKFGGTDELSLWELVQMLLSDRVRNEVAGPHIDIADDLRRLVEIDWLIPPRAFEAMSQQISALNVRENPDFCEAIDIEVENLEMDPEEARVYKEKFFLFIDDLAKVLWENRNRENTLIIFRIGPSFEELLANYSDPI